MADGISVWVPVISALAASVLTGTIQYFMNRQNHYFALEREEKAMAERLRQEKEVKQEKIDRERHFIAIELVFLLEEFAEKCATIAFENRYSLSGTDVDLPEIDLSEVKGDWRVLPARLMYRLREFPVIKQSSDRTITTGHRAPPYFEDATITRRYEYTRLGIRALILARSLRKLAGFHQTRSDDIIWPAKKALIKVWRLEKRRRRNMEMLFEQDLVRAHLKRISGKTTDNNHNNGDNF
nr:hypothetical protein [uncultured Enterobacter sp.]